MKKAAVLVLVVTALALTPLQAFAKPRVFITFSDFISSGKYALYQVNEPAVQPPASPETNTQAPKVSRNIFAKTSNSRSKRR